MRRSRRYRLGAGAWNRAEGGGEEVKRGDAALEVAGVQGGAMSGPFACEESSRGESWPQCLNSNLHALHRNLREQ